MEEKSFRIAVISDTHGKLSEALSERLRSYDTILHAGDFDTQEIYDRLAALGPAFAGVRGNCDWWAYGDFLPPYRSIRFLNTTVFMTHRPQDATRYMNRDHDIVIHGHTHCYRNETVGGILYLNPGSVSEPRDGEKGYLELTIDKNGYRAEHVPLSRIKTGSVNIKSLCNSSVSDLYATVKSVIKLTDSGKDIDTVSSRLGLPYDVTEHLVRLYLTHPGIDADGIIGKLGV